MGISGLKSTITPWRIALALLAGITLLTIAVVTLGVPDTSSHRRLGLDPRHYKWGERVWVYRGEAHRFIVNGVKAKFAGPLQSGVK